MSGGIQPIKLGTVQEHSGRLQFDRGKFETKYEGRGRPGVLENDQCRSFTFLKYSFLCTMSVEGRQARSWWAFFCFLCSQNSDQQFPKGSQVKEFGASKFFFQKKAVYSSSDPESPALESSSASSSSSGTSISGSSSIDWTFKLPAMVRYIRSAKDSASS